MKKRLQIPLFIFIFLISANITFGCSVTYFPINGFSNDYAYLFIGKIVGYTEEYATKKKGNKTYGLKVEAVENINLPKVSNDYFVVVPTRICLGKGIKKSKLMRNYPINSIVKITAFEASKLSPQSETEQIRLVTTFGNIIRNDLKNSYQSSANSIFDYSYWKENKNFIDFELDKDLFRLNQAESEVEKIKILERLAYCPNDLLDYKSIVKASIKDSETEKILLEKRVKAGYSINSVGAIFYRY